MRITVRDYFRNKKHYIEVPKGIDLSKDQFGLGKIEKDRVVLEILTNPSVQGFQKLSEDLKLERPLKENEVEDYLRLQEGEWQRVLKARELVEKAKVSMHIFASRVSWQKKITSFFFTADKPVDFRALLKLMSKAFNGRVHLERVDARERARMLNAGEMCGAECYYHLPINQDKVPLNAVRDQGIMIRGNDKIFDTTGKIKPSMMYELEAYKQCRKYLPHLHQTVRVTASGQKGKVIGLDTLNFRCKVAIEGADVTMCDVAEIEFPKKQPIPEKLIKPLQEVSVDEMIERIEADQSLVRV